MDSADELLVCAYNKAHVVRRSRMALHYRKCELNAAVRLPHCSFNSIHVMRKEEIEEHERNCPDRGNFDKFLMMRTPKVQQNTPVSMPSVSSEENWDDIGCQIDRPVLAVLKEQAKEKDIFLNVSNVPPAQRKAHRKEEAERRHKLQQKNNTQT